MNEQDPTKFEHLAAFEQPDVSPSPLPEIGSVVDQEMFQTKEAQAILRGVIDFALDDALQGTHNEAQVVEAASQDEHVANARQAVVELFPQDAERIEVDAMQEALGDKEIAKDQPQIAEAAGVGDSPIDSSNDPLFNGKRGLMETGTADKDARASMIGIRDRTPGATRNVMRAPKNKLDSLLRNFGIRSKVNSKTREAQITAELASTITDIDHAGGAQELDIGQNAMQQTAVDRAFGREAITAIGSPKRSSEQMRRKLAELQRTNPKAAEILNAAAAANRSRGTVAERTAGDVGKALRNAA